MSAAQVVNEVAQEKQAQTDTMYPGTMRPTPAHASYFHPLELNTMRVLRQRWALAYRLSPKGAHLASSLWAKSKKVGDVVVCYSAKETAVEAHEEKSVFGALLDIQPLFNVTGRDVGPALCQRCLYTADDVGPLEPYAVRTQNGRIALTLCEGCRDADAATEAAITRKQTNTSMIGDVARLFGALSLPMAG